MNPNQKLGMGCLLIIALTLSLFIVCVSKIPTPGDDQKGIELSSKETKAGLLRIENFLIDSEPVILALEKMEQEKSIPVIILRVNTPGGSVVAAQEIYGKILDLKKKGKKIVVSMGAVAASGGYYISCPADKIFANPGTLTGSIGAIMEFPRAEELFRKIGLDFNIIKSGEFKDMGSPHREMKPQEKAMLLKVINDVHSQFTDDIESVRNLEPGKLGEIADGRIFTGRQALSEGLVDTLGSLSEAEAYACFIAGIKGKPKIYEYRKKTKIKDFFLDEVKGLFRRGYKTSYSLF
ncbi:MAG: signal peptide peptidase SppA [Fibrobacterota bacterium]